MKLKTIFLTMTTLIFMHQAVAETNIVFGISQLLIKGGNIEINYLTDNWIFEYSHGFNLDLASKRDLAQTDEENNQGLDLYLPYSTGGGVGYRVTKQFNVRLELKHHRFNVENKKTSQKKSYDTTTVGIGAYYEFLFGNFLIVPNIRYWPNVSTTLDNDKFVFSNNDVHKAHDFGVFANVSLGWKF